MQLLDCPDISKINSGVSPVMFVNGAVLFPKCTFPLRIFEPRYLTMLEQALKTTRSFILSFEDEDSEVNNYSYGTMGLITSAVKQNDGTTLVMLEGLFKVKLIKSDSNHQNWAYEKLSISDSNLDFDLVDKLKLSYNRLCDAIGDCDFPKDLSLSKNVSHSCDVIVDFLVSNIAFKKEYYLINNINKKLTIAIKVIESIFLKN